MRKKGRKEGTKEEQEERSKRDREAGFRSFLHILVA